jgi:hypothetical protein
VWVAVARLLLVSALSVFKLFVVFVTRACRACVVQVPLEAVGLYGKGTEDARYTFARAKKAANFKSLRGTVTVRGPGLLG